MAYTTIDDPTEHFNTIVYTGSGSSTSYTVGFQPDWVWVKKRDTETSNNILVDSIRTTSKTLISDVTDAELTETNITSFDSNGFSAASSGATNQSSHGYVAWNWKAGGSASSNSDGSIASSVSANTTAGFSIVSWTGSAANATVGHGLGVAPKVIIVKNRADATNWNVFHESIGNTGSLYLNSNQGTETYQPFWNNTSPTSSVFTVGSDGATNGSSDAMIAYCITPIKGYSAVAKYTGNGNADGAFVYTGFKPAWIMIKPVVTQNWQIHDLKRLGYNITNKNLSSNSTAVEAENDFMDIVSNGFKIKRADVLNVSDATYIYWAFAESPFVNSSGIPNNAR
jgi:hypothetical protein